MKQITTILFFQLFVITSLLCQVYKPSYDKQYQSLLGEIYTFSVFVDTKDDYWTDEEIDYHYGQFEDSQFWLQNQARKYDKEVEFNNDYFFKNKEVIYLEEVNGYTRNVLQKVLEELRYEDFDDFLDQNSFDFIKNKLKFVLFVKSYGRSHAYNYWSNSEVDIAVIYCRSVSGLIFNQDVISHELLHQFGAWDLYHGTSQSREKAEKAKELYPNSIMISTIPRNRIELEVDELTAWRVGWHDNFKEEYQYFVPVRKNRASERRRTQDNGSSIKFDFGKKKKEKKEGN